MAFCTKCGKQIDDEAQFCNFCGVSQLEETTSEKTGNPYEKKSSNKGIVIAIVVVIIAAVVAAGIYFTQKDIRNTNLKSAFSNAKLVYTTVNNLAADMIADGEPVADIQSTFVAFDCSKSGANKFEQAVCDALKDSGEPGYAMYVTDDNENIVFTAWAKATDTDIVGYYFIDLFGYHKNEDKERLEISQFDGKTFKELYDYLSTLKYKDLYEILGIKTYN